MSGMMTVLLRTAVIGIALVTGSLPGPAVAQIEVPRPGAAGALPTTPPPITGYPSKPLIGLPLPRSGPVVDMDAVKPFVPAETTQDRCRRLATRPIDPEHPTDCPRFGD